MKTKTTKRENLEGARNASLLGMIKYRDNSCRAVPAGWYFKIVASSGWTALGSARESEDRWKKPRHETVDTAAAVVVVAVAIGSGKRGGGVR